jgi:Sec-independent protein translocase protein TatA|tara:strand:+ start:51 stop:212 length:162 start_codon:yes stop_codon:yes gene_type:complete
MDALPLISILVVVFAVILMGEHMKLKKEVRKLQNLTKHLKKDIEQLKGVGNDT